jgi:hypothetical protein
MYQFPDNPYLFSLNINLAKNDLCKEALYM